MNTTGRKIKMNVEMSVTVPQALALQAMFNYWTQCGNWGMSREVGFYVDGDGNFQPNCNISFSESVPKLTKELIDASIAHEDGGDRLYDFDGVGWKLHEETDL